jgi:hypothetical protein
VGNARAGPAGLEPARCGLENRCSVQLSYGPLEAAAGVEPASLVLQTST